ncbi:MAG: ABC transporter permease [Bacteroidaceae bacterium]|nr:ABC transporter permease [Bacteroidaceae bacterium]
MIKIFLNELRRIFSDSGVLIFFIVVPLLYPALYSWLYNNEVVREVPTVVVDDSKSSLSRELIRRLNATPDLNVAAYEENIDEARQHIMRQEARGIVYIPSSFAADIHSHRQTTVSLYVDMSSMLYYKSLLTSLTNVTLDMGSDISVAMLNSQTAREEQIAASPLSYEAVPMFNPGGGYGCFLIPAVLMLVIHQTLILGIGLASGTAREKNSGRKLVLREDAPFGIARIILGKTLCYFMVYFVMACYITMAIPRIFNFIQLADFWQIIAILVPFMLATIFFALALSCLMQQREHVMLIIIFTSVPLLFISGIPWPVSSLGASFKAISYIFPSTFGINAFVKVNSMGASLGDIVFELRALWIQAAVYFLLALYVWKPKRWTQE